MTKHDELLRNILMERTGVDIDEANRIMEIRDVLNAVEDICSHFAVLDDERYGNGSYVYHEDSVPTNREFWREGGVGDSDIENPDEHIPTVELLEYVPEPDGFPRRDITRIDVPQYDRKDQIIPRRIRELLTRLEKTSRDECSND